MVTNPKDDAARVVRDARAVTKFLSFTERADFLREVVKAIRDGVKFDALVGGPSPIGSDEELIGMGEVSGAAEDYYTDALDAQLRADGRK